MMIGCPPRGAVSSAALTVVGAGAVDRGQGKAVRLGIGEYLLYIVAGDDAGWYKIIKCVHLVYSWGYYNQLAQQGSDHCSFITAYGDKINYRM